MAAFRRLKQMHLNRGTPKSSNDGSWRPAIVTGVIAFIVTSVGVLVNYFLIDSTRLELDASKVAIDKTRAAIDKARLELDQLRQSSDEARLALEKVRVDIEKARAAADAERAKVDRARLGIDKARHESQRSVDERRLSSEAARGLADDTRLSIDISKLLADLKPIVKLQCSTSERTDLITIECAFSNLGIHPLRFPPPDVAVLSEETRALLPMEAFEIRSLDGNTVIPRTVANNTYELFVHKEWNGKIPTSLAVRLRFDMQTDPTVVGVARRLAGAHVTEQELEEISKQRYTFNVSHTRRVNQ